jgi:hypothetical protein
MKQPLQRLSSEEMFKELKLAEREKREADFSYKLLPEFSFQEREIQTGLNFEGSTIQGAAYFDKCTIKGDLKLNNTLIYTTLYIANSTIQGEFEAKKAKIREVVNLIASNFKQNINLEEAEVKGFLGLNKINVTKNLNLKLITARDIKTHTGVIKGDIYLRGAKIEGSVILEEALFDGLGDFKETLIKGDLNLKNARFQEVLILTGTIIEGETDTKGMKCKNLIAHLI